MGGRLLLSLIFFSGSSSIFGVSNPTSEAHAARLPLVVNTWSFTDATAAAYEALVDKSTTTGTLDAIVAGCRSCEQSQCDLTVGYGGSPDEQGETSLDAMIMDGESMDVGAVGGLVHCKEAILAARRVLEHTSHSFLAGLQATQFAIEMGLPLDNLTTEKSYDIWNAWQKQKCQPNFRRNVAPDSAASCGPYHIASSNATQPLQKSKRWASKDNHDTISIVAIDAQGRIAAGSSSNGANHKVPGRVGDASVAGGGAYAESSIGGCASTGDGDLHLRFLPCYQVVESMRHGVLPKIAAENAVKRILKFYPSYVGALIAVNARGEHAAACANWDFEYAYKDGSVKSIQVVKVKPVTDRKEEAREEAIAS